MDLETLEAREEEAVKLLNPEAEEDKTTGDKVEGEGAEELGNKPEAEEAGSQGTATPDGEGTADKAKAQDESIPADENSASWKQKFLTLEGKYRAEVPLLNADVKQWRDSAVALNGKIAALEKAVEDFKSKESSAVNNVEIEKLSKEYPDIGKVIKTIADDAEAKIAALKKEVHAGVASELDGVRAEVKANNTTNFDLAMRAAGIDDWQDIDNSPEWAAWLNVEVPMTGKPRLHFLQEAAGAKDAKAVAKFFNQFKAEKAASNPPPQVEEGGKDKLEKFVAPPSNKTGKQPGAGAQTSYTLSDYQKFMDETTRGKYNPKTWGGKAEDVLEKEFNVLIAAGKLR
jgi:hypothetical protein